MVSKQAQAPHFSSSPSLLLHGAHQGLRAYSCRWRRESTCSEQSWGWGPSPSEAHWTHFLSHCSTSATPHPPLHSPLNEGLFQLPVSLRCDEKGEGQVGNPAPPALSVKSSAGDKGTGTLRCLPEQEALTVGWAPAQ